MMAAALPLLLRHWRWLGIALLLAALAAQSWRLGRAGDALARCRAATQAQADDFARAQKAALDLANAAKRRKETDHAIARHEADTLYADLGRRYRALVLRHAFGAAAGGAGARPLPRPAAGARGADPAGAAPLLPGDDALTGREDALICAENTARLEAARAWAMKISKADELDYSYAGDDSRNTVY